jgi:hypothetical protein
MWYEMTRYDMTRSRCHWRWFPSSHHALYMHFSQEKLNQNQNLSGLLSGTQGGRLIIPSAYPQLSLFDGSEAPGDALCKPLGLGCHIPSTFKQPGGHVAQVSVVFPMD